MGLIGWIEALLFRKSLHGKLDLLLQEVNKMALDLTDLIATVEKVDNVLDSSVVFIHGLEDKITELEAELTGMPEAQAKLAELRDALNTHADAVALAISTVPATG